MNVLIKSCGNHVFFHDLFIKNRWFCRSFMTFSLLVLTRNFSTFFYAILLLKWSQNYIKKTSKIHHLRLLIRRIPFWGPPRSFWAPFGYHLKSFGLHFNPLGRTVVSILGALAPIWLLFARVEPNLSRFRMLLIAFWLHFRSLAYFFHTCKLLQLFCPGST